MTELERSLRQVALDLETLDRRFAVVGGLAVSIRAEPRLTRDVDVEVLPGLVLPVATIGHLIVMKLLARDDRRRPTMSTNFVAMAPGDLRRDRTFEADRVWRLGGIVDEFLSGDIHSGT